MRCPSRRTPLPAWTFVCHDVVHNGDAHQHGIPVCQHTESWKSGRRHPACTSGLWRGAFDFATCCCPRRYYRHRHRHRHRHPRRRPLEPFRTAIATCAVVSCSRSSISGLLLLRFPPVHSPAHRPFFLSLIPFVHRSHGLVPGRRDQGLVPIPDRVRLP